MRILFLVLSLLAVVSAATVNPAWHSHEIDLPTGISDVVAVTVNNRIYLAGGCMAPSQPTDGGPCSNVTSTMWMLTENATSWIALPSMPRRRYRYAAAAVGNLIYYVGGRVYYNASQEFSDVVVPEVDVFNTQTQIWSTLSPQNCDCTSNSDAAAFVIGTKLYVSGGYAIFYDLLNSTIVLDTSVPIEQQQFQANVVAQRNWMAGDLGAVTVNGIGYVMGGFSTDYCYPISTMSSYDPTANKWTDRKPFLHRRGDFAYASIGQYIYVIGGETKAAGCTPEKLTLAVPVADVERYDTVTNEWIDYAPIAIQRFRFTAVAVKDEILDIGGQGEAINNAFPLIPDVYVLNVTEYEINRTRTTVAPTTTSPTTATPTTPAPGKNDATMMMRVSIMTIVAMIAATFL